MRIINTNRYELLIETWLANKQKVLMTGLFFLGGCMASINCKYKDMMCFKFDRLYIDTCILHLSLVVLFTILPKNKFLMTETNNFVCLFSDGNALTLTVLLKSYFLQHR